METERYAYRTPSEQFDRSTTVEIGNEKLEMVDVSPDQKKSEIPVFMAAGWTGTADMFKNNIMKLVESGRRTLSVQNPHGISSPENPDQEAELRRAAALLTTLKEKGIDKTDAIGMSEGAIYLILAAQMQPERFRNLVLVDPGGMIGKDNVWKLVKRFTADIVGQLASGKNVKELLKLSSGSAKSIAQDPIETVKQVFAIAESQIHEMLRDLKQKGIGISIIHGVDDKAFPMERVQQTAKSDMLDGFYSVKGTHNQFVLEPEKYTKLAAEALTALEAKQADQQLAV